MKKLYHLFLTFALLSAAGCNDFLDPDDDNSYKGDELLTYIQRAEGVLLNAYASVPNANQISVMTDVATDNAVWNTSSGNAFRNIVSGEWSSTNNPFDKWSSAYTAIGYCNLFLDELVDRVEWSYSDAWLCEAFRERLTAEARGLRAYYYMELLTAHSGVGVNTGRLLGVPMIMHPIDVEEGDLDFPRDTYERCVALVLEDLQFAIDHLPYEYKNNSEKPEEDRVYGARFANRLCGRIAMALKARLLLQAASPAFNPDNDAAKWAAAAVAAAELIDASGGIDAIDKSRIKFWLDDTSREIVWRKDYYTGRDWETTCFPPSLLGNGRMNPTQDFADAFPYRNGVPYVPGNPSDPDDPYAGRDPRLDEYLIRNGSLFKDNVINTVDGDVDGINRKPSSSTTTGYYMKKLMNPSVNHTTGSVVTTRHFHTLLRMTEVYLIFAEAANEAWGPDGQGTVGYSARDVIARIRSTGGITPDQYLPTVATQADMRRLIRNERRLELAFENQRFWDVRRWKDEQAMMRAATGTRDGGKTAFEVESRVFMDYMIYGPIPYDEQMKGLEQNRGW